MNLSMLAASFAGVPTWIQVIVGVCGATGIGAVVLAMVKGKLYRRNTDASASLKEAEADSLNTKTARELMQDMRADIKDMRNRIDDCETDRAELHRLYEQSARELAAALKRITNLEGTIAVYEARLRRAGEKTDMERT